MARQVKEIVPGAQGLLDQVTERVPGAQELIVGLVLSLEAKKFSQRDASGEDLGPVARHSGLLRTQWHRIGGQAVVEYHCKVSYVTVLDYYAKGFSLTGFAQTVQSSTLEAETHDYAEGDQRFILKIAQSPPSGKFNPKRFN